MTVLADGAPVAQSERWATVHDRAMFARVWDGGDGSRRPVVCVPGLVVSGAYFVPTAERLAAEWRVYAPDLPGFGRSEAPDDVLTVPRLADALTAWLAAMDLAAASLVANSFGCQIAVELAMRRPRLVDRLVLVAPTVDPTARSTRTQLRRWWQESSGQSRALKQILLRDYAAAGIPRALQTFRHALRDRIEDKLPHVAAPALVVCGTADPIVPQPWAEEVAHLLPDGRLVVLPGAPHTMNFETPGELVAAIRPFLLGRDA